jgi:hypothetical protein
MNKNLQEILKKENTAQNWTIEEVLEFTDSNIQWLAKEYENAVKLEENNIQIGRDALYSLIVDLKQLRDKLKETSAGK